MEFLTYFPAAIVAYLGLFLGIILIKLAPEEQNPGIKYFILFKKILFFLIVLFLLIFYEINLLLSIILIIIILILLLNKKIKLEKPYIEYLILGIIFFLSSKILNLFVIESTLIFLYGIPTASLLFKVKKRNYFDILAKNLWFFAPVVALYFVV